MRTRLIGIDDGLMFKWSSTVEHVQRCISPEVLVTQAFNVIKDIEQTSVDATFARRAAFINECQRLRDCAH